MLLALDDYRFLKLIHSNLIENRDYFYVLNGCLDLDEARRLTAPWIPPGKAYIAQPSPEAIAKYKANPFKVKGGKKIAKNPPREGFQGALLHGIQNAKVAKSWKKGYASYILNLSPAEESGFNLCSCSTAGCALACLHLSGSPVYQKAKMQSRLGNTFYLIKQRKKFIEQLVSELTMAKKFADEEGKKMAVRLNGTSDLPWESPEFGMGGKNIFQMFPDIQFYDYTKVSNRAMKFVQGQQDPNYHLTFSYSERPGTVEVAKKILDAGGNVAIVFGPGKNQGIEKLEMPKVWNGYKVVDGDESDLRFEDEKGTVVGLTAKSDAAWDFNKITPEQLAAIQQVVNTKKFNTSVGLSKGALQALAQPQTLFQVIDILRQVPNYKDISHKGTGFVVPPEDPSVDPRTYPENMTYVVQGIQKKISRAFGKDKREYYRQMRQDFYAKHSSLYTDYLKRIEKYCQEHPEECQDTNTRFTPLAKPNNPLQQAGIGIQPQQLIQMGILPKDHRIKGQKDNT